MQRTLSVERVNTICAQLLPIADRIIDYMDQLEDAGFGAFVPYRDFVSSFGTSQEDQELHRLCLIEGAKNRLARPMPLAMIRAYGKHFYFSPLVRELLDERDQQNGVPEEELSSRYPGEIWRGEVDPCERRKVLKRATERESYESAWESMRKRGKLPKPGMM